jgi:hypothetical protein
MSGWLRTSRTGCSGASALVGHLSGAFPLRHGAKHPELDSDVPTEQRLQGFEPLRCCGRGGPNRGDFPEPAGGQQPTVYRPAAKAL